MTSEARRLTQRSISRSIRVSDPAPGFAGAGHMAVEVFSPSDLSYSNPFVALMDDRIDFNPGDPVGGAHPHAGLETVTLLLQGSLSDADEGDLNEGDVAWMTAGRGVVHNEHLFATGCARILQLWIALPSAARRVEPRLQILRLDTIPIRREPGVEARLYSGVTGEYVSLTHNHTPVTLVDFRLAPGAATEQALPGRYSGVLYVISGGLQAGGAILESGEVGWLGAAQAPLTELSLIAGATGARVLLYAGAPLDEPLVQQGPFVAGSAREIADFYDAYRSGQFVRIANAARL